MCGLCRAARASAVTRPPLHVLQPASAVPAQHDAYGNPVCAECGTVWRENKFYWPLGHRFNGRIKLRSNN